MTANTTHVKKAVGAAASVSVARRILLTLVGVVQVGLALAAFSDLWARRDDEVRLAKPAWIPVILVNWIGPAAYFLFGVKR